MSPKGDWGQGILMSQAEYDVIKDLDETFGFRELRAKILGRAGITDKLSICLSLNVESCFRPASIEVERKYLDSGVLQAYYDKTYDPDRDL